MNIKIIFNQKTNFGFVFELPGGCGSKTVIPPNLKPQYVILVSSQVPLELVTSKRCLRSLLVELLFFGKTVST